MTPLARRTILSLGALTIGSTATGCFGSFAATRALWRFNDGVSDSKWLRWLVFLALAILPVYNLFILGDLVIFNTIEFFTDSNPISADTRDLGGGRVVLLERDRHDRNLVRVELQKDGVKVGAWYVQRSGDELRLLDEHRRPISAVGERSGDVLLTDATGRELARLDEGAQRRASSRLRETGSAERAIADVLDGANAPELVARIRAARATL